MKAQFTQITFNAFAQSHVVYDDQLRRLEYYDVKVSEFVPTAYVTDVCTTLITQQEFEENSIEGLRNWPTTYLEKKVNSKSI